MFVAFVVIALVTWHANVFTINALLSSLIAFPAGGSEAVRISLAFGISDHCLLSFCSVRSLFLCRFPLALVFRRTPTVLSADAFDIALIKFL